MLFGYFSNCDTCFKFQIKDVFFFFNFTTLQKCSTNEFFNLETITSSHNITYNIASKFSLFG